MHAHHTILLQRRLLSRAADGAPKHVLRPCFQLRSALPTIPTLQAPRSLSTTAVPRRREIGEGRADSGHSGAAAFVAMLAVLSAGCFLTKVVSADEVKETEAVVEEPVTKKPIPTTLTLTLGATPQHFTLLGLGVRQVTFLNVSVYTIGYYISTPSIARLRSSPSFKSYTPATLSDFTAPLTRDTSTPLALRISPVRNTDGPHLRNGFMRILTRQLAAEDAMLTPEEKKGVLEAMDELRAAFPAGKVAKGEVFVFVKTEGGELRMVHEGVEKTVVRNRWVAERFFEGYLLDGKKVISEKLRKSIAEGLEHIIKA